MMREKLKALIAGGETMTAEFKGESAKRLSDRELYEAVVCLANAAGGTLLIGVEDDGEISGARARHEGGTRTENVRAAIRNNTEPALDVSVQLHEIDSKEIVVIAVFVAEQERAGNRLSLDDLLVLDHLRHERRIDAELAGRLTQRGTTHGRATLERLTEQGMIEAKGEKRGRIYHLSASVYETLGLKSGYVRSKGFTRIRQEAMVLEFVQAHGRVTRADVVELCDLGGDQASRLLRRLAKEGELKRVGEKRGAHYVPKSEE